MQYTADGNRSTILAACWQLGHRQLVCNEPSRKSHQPRSGGTDRQTLDFRFHCSSAISVNSALDVGRRAFVFCNLWCIPRAVSNAALRRQINRKTPEPMSALVMFAGY